MAPEPKTFTNTFFPYWDVASHCRLILLASIYIITTNLIAWGGFASVESFLVSFSAAMLCMAIEIFLTDLASTVLMTYRKWKKTGTVRTFWYILQLASLVLGFYDVLFLYFCRYKPGPDGYCRTKGFPHLIDRLSQLTALTIMTVIIVVFRSLHLSPRLREYCFREMPTQQPEPRAGHGD